MDELSLSWRAIRDRGRSREALAALLQGEARKIEAVLLLPPYYFSKVTDAGLERWLRLILEGSRMPVFLYASHFRLNGHQHHLHLFLRAPVKLPEAILHL